MKKLIVLATLAALPAVAMADVTISGNIGVAVQNIKLGKAGSTNTMTSQEGDVQFSGSEALGNGLKAIWKYDHQFNTDKVNAQGENLETFVGLSGSFGKIQFGATDNAPREIGAVGLADLPTVFGVHDVADLAESADNYVVYKAARKRVKDGITYVAPQIGGLTVAVSHALKTPDDNAKTSATAVGIKYAVNDMLTLAYASNAIKQTFGKTNTANEINAALSLGDVGVNLGYATRKDYSNATTSKKGKGVALSGSYAMGATTLIAGFYKQNDTKTNGRQADDGYKNYTLGVNYDLSKRTHVGFEWGKEDRKGSDKDVRGATTYIWHSF